AIIIDFARHSCLLMKAVASMARPPTLNGLFRPRSSSSAGEPRERLSIIFFGVRENTRAPGLGERGHASPTVSSRSSLSTAPIATMKQPFRKLLSHRRIASSAQRSIVFPVDPFLLTHGHRRVFGSGGFVALRRSPRRRADLERAGTQPR